MGDALDRATLAGLLEMVGDDPAFVGDLVDTYLADADGLLAAMRAAIASGSAADLVRPAHTLKGNSLNLGAEQLASICRELELRARDGSLDGATERMAAAEAAFVEVHADLETARAEGWQLG